MARRMMQPLQGWVNSFSRPRVARKTAQPWANIHNPVGVQIHVPHVPSKLMRTRIEKCHLHFRATMKIHSKCYTRSGCLDLRKQERHRKQVFGRSEAFGRTVDEETEEFLSVFRIHHKTIFFPSWTSALRRPAKRRSLSRLARHDLYS